MQTLNVYASFIKKTPVLWGLLIMAIASVYGFSLWMPHVGGPMLDSLSAMEPLRAQIDRMTEAQKQSHIVMTLVLDTLFPVVVGSLLAGLALKFYTRTGVWLAIPALAVIPCDWLENAIQILALSGLTLSGDENLLAIKVVVTLSKNILFIVAACIGCAGLVIGAIQKILSR